MKKLKNFLIIFYFAIIFTVLGSLAGLLISIFHYAINIGVPLDQTGLGGPIILIVYTAIPMIGLIIGLISGIFVGKHYKIK